MKQTRSFLIGVLAGLRSQTAPCAAAWALAGRSDHLPWPFSLIGKRSVRTGLTVGAAIELVGDKLPITPSRTAPAGLFARVLAGGGTGACVAPAGLQLRGLAAGVAGALIGTFGGHKLRVTLPGALGVPDFYVALAEDAIAIGGSLAVTRSLPSAGGCRGVRQRLVLASASPRRRELMTALGYDFEVVPAELDEEALTYGRDPSRVARRLARAKALFIASQHPDAYVLAGDTVVAHRGDMLGKPVDAGDARRMLSRLAGQTHRVVTGVAVVAPGSRRPIVDHATTLVRLRNLTVDEIETSIAKGDPFDKAGAYAIQDPALRPIEAYEGCFCNVMGLPSNTTRRLLEAAGVSPSREAAMPEACTGCPWR